MNTPNTSSDPTPLVEALEETQTLLKLIAIYFHFDWPKPSGKEIIPDKIQGSLKKLEVALATFRANSGGSNAMTDWQDGYPPKPFATEWFIAITEWGDRVVLTALPEEYSYDFKTADDTYLKKEKVKKWRQFPDSAFIPFVTPPTPEPRANDSKPISEILKGFPVTDESEAARVAGKEAAERLKAALVSEPSAKAEKCPNKYCRDGFLEMFGKGKRPICPTCKGTGEVAKVEGEK